MTPKEKELIIGFAVPSTKTFYYLITGPVPMDLNKLHNMLVGSDVIKIVDNAFTPYTIMNMLDAEDAGYNPQPKFLSKIVKDKWEKQQSTTSSNLWG